MLTDASNNILTFTQFGRFFEWKAITTDIASGSNSTTTRQLLTVRAPSGSIALMNWVNANVPGATQVRTWVRSTSFADVAASGVISNNTAISSGVNDSSFFTQTPVDSSNQVAWRKNITCDIYAVTQGFIDNL